MINTIRSSNFHAAWVDAIRFVLDHGTEITFGSERKRALDSTQLIILEGNAIEQIRRRETHPLFPFRGEALRSYCSEFTREFLDDYAACDSTSRFDYTYLERFLHSTDQLRYMRENLHAQVETGVLSNTCQAVTWIPEIDCLSRAAPCLQRIWLRLSGDRTVDMHLSWRSRDLYGAWQANLIALTYMIEREVLQPCRCTLSSIVDFSDSLHIYMSDLDAAQRVPRRA